MNVFSILILLVLVAGIIMAFSVSARRMKKGSSCCGEKGEKVPRNGVSDRNKAHYPYRAEAVITQMTCDNCAARVENALNREDGIWATVRIGTGKAVIRAKKPIEQEKIRHIIAQTGYGMGAFTVEP